MIDKKLTPQRAKEYFLYKEGNLFYKISSNSKIKIGQKAGYKNPNGYVTVSVDNVQYRAHQVIFLMFHGYLPEQIDHINNIRCDNRIENLRPSNKLENAKNRPINKNNTSGYKNVYKSGKKWRVMVGINGEYKNFGSFQDIELAHLVAIEARNKYHGEFSNHA